MIKYSFGIEKAKKQDQTLYALAPEKPERKIYLHSRIDPIAEAQSFISHAFKDLDSKQFSAVIVFGLGLGHHIRALCQQISTSCQVLVFERYHEIAEIVTCDFPAQVQCFLMPDRQLVANLISRLPTYKVHFLMHRPSHALCPQYYDQLWQWINKAMADKDINIATLARFEKIWLKNFFGNIPQMLQGLDLSNLVSQIQKQSLSRIAILLAGGPSLNENLAIIHQHRSSLFLVAVDTALQVVLAAGIQPDIVFTVDAQFVNSLYLLGIDCRCPLVCEPTCHYSALRHWQGPLFFIASPFSYTRWLEQHLGPRVELKHGGSVSTTAFDFIRLCGFQKIVLVGQDLAFSKHRAHAVGTTLDENLYSRMNRLSSRENALFSQFRSLPPYAVPANHGGLVLTNNKLDYFRNWFVGELATMSQEVINTALDGAQIAGCVCRNLSSFLADQGDCFKSSETLMQFITLSKSPMNLAVIASIVGDLERWLTNIDIMVQILEQGRQAARDLLKVAGYQKYKRHQDSRIKGLFHKMDHCDKKIRQFEEENSLLGPTMQRVIKPIVEGSHGQEEDNPIKANALVSQKLYEGMIETLLFSQAVFQKSVIQLKHFR